MISELLETLLPSRCLVCDSSARNSFLCKNCKLQIKPSFFKERCLTCFGQAREDSICTTCQHLPPLFKTIRYLVDYELNEKDLILTMKRKPSKKLAYYLCLLARENISHLYKQIDFDYVTPIPPYKRNLIIRGFNQSKILAQVFNRQILDILINTEAKPQASLKLEERVKNLERIIPKIDKDLSNKKVLLVDDVLTSGATSFSAANAIYNLGAKEVHLFTFARSSSWEGMRLYYLT